MLKSLGWQNLPARKSHRCLWAMPEVLSCPVDLLEVLPGTRKDSPFPRSSDVCWLQRWQKLNFEALAVGCVVPGLTVDHHRWPEAQQSPLSERCHETHETTGRCAEPPPSLAFKGVSILKCKSLLAQFLLVEVELSQDPSTAARGAGAQVWIPYGTLTAQLLSKKDPILSPQTFCYIVAAGGAHGCECVRVCGRSVDSTGG